MVEEAKVEAQRMLEALRPQVERGVAIVGLEPSCLLTLRDEYLAMGLGDDAVRLAGQAVLFEEFIAAQADAGILQLKLAPLPSRRLCYALAVTGKHSARRWVRKVLSRFPDRKSKPSIELLRHGRQSATSRAFRRQHEMAELTLLPASGRQSRKPSLLPAAPVAAIRFTMDAAARRCMWRECCKWRCRNDCASPLPRDSRLNSKLKRF
jgi:hypothetical protein